MDFQSVDKVSHGQKINTHCQPKSETINFKRLRHKYRHKGGPKIVCKKPEGKAGKK